MTLWVLRGLALVFNATVTLTVLLAWSTSQERHPVPLLLAAVNCIVGIGLIYLYFVAGPRWERQELQRRIVEAFD